MLVTVALTIVGIKAYEYGKQVVAQRNVEEETAKKVAKWQEDAERRAQLVREATQGEFLTGLDPQDAALWGALVPFAELDRDCNALPECTQDSMHVARPIVVTARSGLGDLMHTAVLGIEAWAPQGHVVIPRITYYAGHQGGALWRMRTGATQAEVRTPHTDEWHPVVQSASGEMRDDVRTAFIHDLQRRITNAAAAKEP